MDRVQAPSSFESHRCNDERTFLAHLTCFPAFRTSSLPLFLSALTFLGHPSTMTGLIRLIIPCISRPSKGRSGGEQGAFIMQIESKMSIAKMALAGGHEKVTEERGRRLMREREETAKKTFLEIDAASCSIRLMDSS